MEPRPINEGDRATWAALHPREFKFTGPGEIDHDIEPCAALVTDDGVGGGKFGKVVRVPWTLDPEELAMLADGGTLWLSTWGALPIHSLMVVTPGQVVTS
jgi:hypothetical protein